MNRKGPQYELDLLKFFRSEGLDAERLRTTGRHDEGDLVVKIGGMPYVIEAKNCKTMELGPWVDEAAKEASNYAKHRELGEATGFLVVHKRRMKPLEQSFVTMPLHEWLEQVRD